MMDSNVFHLVTFLYLSLFLTLIFFLFFHIVIFLYLQNVVYAFLTVKIMNRIKDHLKFTVNLLGSSSNGPWSNGLVNFDCSCPFGTTVSLPTIPAFKSIV